jgi:hypothetical protein
MITKLKALLVACFAVVVFLVGMTPALAQNSAARTHIYAFIPGSSPEETGAWVAEGDITCLPSHGWGLGHLYKATLLGFNTAEVRGTMRGYEYTPGHYEKFSEFYIDLQPDYSKLPLHFAWPGNSPSVLRYNWHLLNTQQGKGYNMTTLPGLPKDQAGSSSFALSVQLAQVAPLILENSYLFTNNVGAVPIGDRNGRTNFKLSCQLYFP